MSATRTKPKFEVGDRVRVKLGSHEITGEVVEYRGAIGKSQRHLFVVELPMDPYEPETRSYYEEAMTAVPPDEPKPVLTREQIVEYLGDSGLLSMMLTETEAGRFTPCVWLRVDDSGRVTHTFAAKRGLVGGHGIPFVAFRNPKLFREGRGRIVEFIKGFGLTDADADQVIARAGFELRQRPAKKRVKSSPRS